MVTGMETADRPALEALLGPQLTADQAREIFAQGQEAVVFALLTLAQRLATTPTPRVDPAAPSGQTPPYLKPPRTGRAKKRGARLGHTGHRRPKPTHIDRREEHTLSACPNCQGAVTPCAASRTRVVEDIPDGPMLSQGAALVRPSNGERVYLIDRGTKRAIPSAETMERCHFNEKKICVVPPILTDQFPNGKPLAVPAGDA